MSEHDLFFPEDFEEERLKDIETKWAAESEARIDAVDRGELELVGGPSALRDLRVAVLDSHLKGI